MISQFPRRRDALLTLAFCLAFGGCATNDALVLDPSYKPTTAADFVRRGAAKERKGDLYGALADYDLAESWDRSNTDLYAYSNNVGMAINRQVAADEEKASGQDPKFGAAFSNQTSGAKSTASYDLITATYTSGSPDRNSQTQTIQRHRFVDGKFVKTEQIYQITEFGVPGITGTIWRDRYIVSDWDLSILDLWTGKTKRFGKQAPPPDYMYVLVRVSPEELVVENLHTTPGDQAAAIAEAKARNNLYRLRDPNGRLESLPSADVPPWPNHPSISAQANHWEISPNGNRRAMHPFPGEKPAPEEGLWLYDWKSGEKKFLAGAFYDPAKAPGPDPCLVWLDNDRFVTFRPDGEIILVQWDGKVTSLGRAADPGQVKNDLVLDRDGSGRILSVKFSLGTDYTSLVDVDAKTVTKADTWKLGHDWEVSLPLGPNTPMVLQHAGQTIVKTRTSGGLPSVSPDGVNVAIYDADKLQNHDPMQKMYLRVYSLATKEWVDFPANERPIAWIPAAPETAPTK